jgi:hypothetical protein
MTDESKPPYDKMHEEPGHREERIRKRAYEMWEAEGCPDGKADQYWVRAEELIEDENQSAYPPSQSRGGRN